MLTELNDNCNELMQIFIGMSQVTRCCRQDVAFYEGVTFHQFMILDAVAKKKELNMADLHKLLSVEKSTTTRLVNPLIQKGLLRRDKAAHDSRAVTLVLTQEGREIREKIWLCLTGFFQKISRNIPESRKNDVLKAVQVFIEAIRNSTADYSCCK